MTFSFGVTPVPRVVFALAVCGILVASLFGRHARAQADSPMLEPGLTALQIAEWEDAGARHLDYLPNQVLVKFKDGTTVAGAQRALMALRSRPDVSDLEWIGPVALLHDLGQSDANILASQLREQPEVAYAQPNYIRHKDSTPNDPSFATKQWQMTALDMPRAWDINDGANGIIVAVIDDGPTSVTATFTARTWNGSAIVNFPLPFATNPDLPASRLVFPHDFVTGRGDTVLAVDRHGTHVSGSVGEETNNGIMLAGMAYKTQIMPLKVCVSYWDIQLDRSGRGIPGFVPPGTNGGCPEAATTAAIRYAADNGAKVINFSIGGPGESLAQRDAVTYAVSKGTFVSVSAGNSYATGNPIDYPAKYAETIEGVVAVASVGKSLKHAFYSSSGSYVEIAAPGGDRREAGDAGGIWQSSINAADFDEVNVIFPRFDRYIETSINGTSMASPHVAGMAALIYSQLGVSATPALVEQIIKKTARACGATDCVATNLPAGRNDFFGAGLIQPRTALFGSGLRK